MFRYGLSDWHTEVAAAAFILTWLMIAKHWECMPVGKAIGSLFGAGVMVQTGVLSAAEAYGAIDMSTLLMLLGLMLLLAHLETKGLIGVLVDLVTSGNASNLSILIRLSLLSGAMAAFIMNDGAAIFLSLVVIRVCQLRNVPVGPYMITVATSANIGSVSTVLGNPKNMVIHTQANLNFLGFFLRMGPPAMVGILLNTFMASVYFRKALTYNDNDNDDNSSIVEDEADDDDDDDVAMTDRAMIEEETRRQRRHNFNILESKEISGEETPLLSKSPTTQEILDPMPWNSGEETIRQRSGANTYHSPNFEMAAMDDKSAPTLKPLNLYGLFDWDALVTQAWEFRKSQIEKKLKKRPNFYAKHVKPIISFCASRNGLVGLLIVSMYVLFLLDFDLGWTTLFTAVLVVMVERIDPVQLFAEVNFPLLLYILGLFVAIKGINMTPVTGWFWSLIAPLVKPSSPLPLAVFGLSALVLLLCLVFTSIPCVLLVSPHLTEMGGPIQGFGWLLLSWCVTLCGNLTMFSSVAGVICQEAAAGFGGGITFMQWFRYAFPSTIVILSVGATLISIEGLYFPIQAIATIPSGPLTINATSA